MNHRFVLLSSLLAFSTFAAQSQTSDLNSDLKKSVEASNSLGLEVLKQRFEMEGSQKNLNFSPLSLNQALSLVTLGANDRTEQILKDKLGLDVVSTLKAENTLKNRLALLKTVEGDDDYTFETANALFTNGENALLPSYLEKGNNILQAQVRALDFRNSASAGLINAWASEKTHGKINQIIAPDVLAGLESLVANATYFKAKWQLPFETSDYMTLGFTKIDGSRANVPSMRRRLTLPMLTRAGEFKATRLDYKGDAASFYVIVPENLPAYLSDLSNESLNRVLADIDASKAEPALVQMPSFKFKNSMNLNQALEDLGLGIIFDSAADFSKMSKYSLKVSYVKQDSFIAVDNEGTEAAAVTSVGFESTSVEPHRPYVFSVDSSFLYVIRDNRSGDILFVGTVIDPTI